MKYKYAYDSIMIDRSQSTFFKHMLSSYHQRNIWDALKETRQLYELMEMRAKERFDEDTPSAFPIHKELGDEK